MKLKVRFFALYRERAGTRERTLNLPQGATVAQLLKTLQRLYPQLAPPQVNIVVAVNTEYADNNMVLSDGDEVALIPPVSGGQR